MYRSACRNSGDSVQAAKIFLTLNLFLLFERVEGSIFVHKRGSFAEVLWAKKSQFAPLLKSISHLKFAAVKNLTLK